MKIIRRLEQDVFQWVGSKPVGAIRPMELLTLLKRVEHRGAVETTHRVQQNCGQAFRYAVATGRAQSDPGRDLRGALTPWKPEHHPTLTDARDVCRLVRDIEAYGGGFFLILSTPQPDHRGANRSLPHSRRSSHQTTSR